MPYWKIVLSFALGLFVGIGSGWMWFTNEAQVLTADSSQKAAAGSFSDSNNNPPKKSEASGVALSVSPSQLAGTSVEVLSVSLESAGWIVVYEDRGGVPGNALGALRLEKGSHANVSVPLLRATVPDALYYVVLHGDSGERAFSLDEDFPLRDKEGSPFMVPFRTASGGAAV